MNTLNALMYEIIDYAGLFPPASLSLEESLREFARYRNHPYRHWLSSRFVISTPHLPKLTTFLAANPKLFDGDLKLAVLLPVPEDPKTVNETLVEARDSLRAAETSALVRADAIEFAVPRFSPFKDYLAQIRDLFTARQFFVEIPFGDNGGLLMHHVASLRRSEGIWCAKFRTGGLRPEQVPSSEDLAEHLVTAAMLGLPWKATAGLHEPVQHFDAQVGARLHGFLNLLGAAAACLGGERSPTAVARILNDHRYADFAFGEDECRIGTMAMSKSAIAELRHEFALSIGSCSFLEPVERLQTHFPDAMK